MKNVSPDVSNEEVLVLHNEINYLSFEVVCCVLKRDAKPAPDGIVKTSVVLFNLLKRQQNTLFRTFAETDILLGIIMVLAYLLENMVTCHFFSYRRSSLQPCFIVLGFTHVFLAQDSGTP